MKNPTNRINNMLNKTEKMDNLRRIAIGLMIVFVLSSGVYAQAGNTPESRIKSFYIWYLTAINKQQDPSKNKTVMKSHLSTRFGVWFYSKAGQNLDYDIFVNGQEWNEAWVNNVIVGKAAIKGSTAVVKVKLGSPADDWNMNLQVSLVKEGGNWKIDRVKGQ